MNTFVVVTCNRPDRLKKCIENIRNNTTGSIEIFVSDDSQQDEAQDKNREIVNSFDDEGLKVQYFGKKEKKSYLSQIQSIINIQPEVIDFLFFDPFDQKMSAGANRNFALLLTKGKCYVSLDDDIEFAPHRFKNLEENFRFEPFVDMGEITPLLDIQSAESYLSRDDRDTLSLIDTYLSQNLNDILKKYPERSKAINKVDARWAMSVLMSIRKVKLCSFGLFGHSGFSSNDFIFSHPPRDLSLLPNDKESFNKMLASQLIIRGFSSLTFANISMAPAGAVAIDNTELLPPFFPILRGEDMAWSSVLRYLLPTSVFCYLNSYLKHEADVESSSMQHRQQSSMQLQPFHHLVTQLVNHTALTHKKRSYQELAQVLESVNETQVKGLLELATKKINEVRSKVLKDLKLQENTNLPTYWKDEVRRLIQEHEAAVRENKLFIPNDIKLNGKSLEFQAAQLISFYGKALRVWPEIIRFSL